MIPLLIFINSIAAKTPNSNCFDSIEKNLTCGVVAQSGNVLTTQIVHESFMNLILRILVALNNLVHLKKLGIPNYSLQSVPNL